MDVILKVKNIDKNVIDLLEQNGLELEHILKVAPVILGKTDNPRLITTLG
ncbi:MAG: hypothetical protein KGZ54_04200 [Dethiobacter sp.]|jgi:hypothetical protein|nr:hypothetical protein [Dethiobacter sp.]MBS3901203.1 hypothetical protein [Dethiobacter sp.]MBS3989105.1 hypothetical protein [Dethiobacter sp.]